MDDPSDDDKKRAARRVALRLVELSASYTTDADIDEKIELSGPLLADLEAAADVTVTTDGNVGRIDATTLVSGMVLLAQALAERHRNFHGEYPWDEMREEFADEATDS